MEKNCHKLKIHSDIFYFFFRFFRVSLKRYGCTCACRPLSRIIRARINVICFCICFTVVARRQCITFVGILRRFSFQCFMCNWAADHFQRQKTSNVEHGRVVRLHKMPFFIHYYFSLFQLHFSSFRIVARLLLPVLLFCHLCVIHSCSNKQKAYIPRFLYFLRLFLLLLLLFRFTFFAVSLGFETKYLKCVLGVGVPACVCVWNEYHLPIWHAPDLRAATWW